jgi:ribA/ribD-fused uncharacterized protein
MVAESKITSFSGEYRWMSNFWPSPVTYQGVVYPSVEHIYQAMKTLDESWRAKILSCETPGRAKRMSREVPLRPDWEEVKVGIMTELVQSKFASSEELARKLLGTGERVIEEGNTWGDTFWGVCKGEGQNMMGRILMQVRSELRESRKQGLAESQEMWEEVLEGIE